MHSKNIVTGGYSSDLIIGSMKKKFRSQIKSLLNNSTFTSIFPKSTFNLLKHFLQKPLIRSCLQKFINNFILLLDKHICPDYHLSFVQIVCASTLWNLGRLASVALNCPESDSWRLHKYPYHCDMNCETDYGPTC
ncbi:hypothetical protein BpHYR1_014372 [Brachionus plicatilis]|uniref:Uncharacterized protein n=1 Tax=Brachionus plicatilis TaxID=10195 RepID=A0A3M7RLG3_BRAPC|nr:hypothetical protein BpHYR1_014372 [Brachionus plicatilis]